MINFLGGMRIGKRERAIDLEAYVNLFMFSVERHLDNKDYNIVSCNLRICYNLDSDIIPNQRITHDFACEQLAPLLAVAVEQKPLISALEHGSPERAAIQRMYSQIVETVQKYCKKYGLDYKKLLAEVRRQAPLGDNGFTSPGYHIAKEGGAGVLTGGFFLDKPKIYFKGCEDFGVRNVSL